MQGRAARAIDRVAKQRAAQRGAVDADLVGSAGAGVEFQPGQSIGLAAQHPIGHRALACGGDDHAPTRAIGLLEQLGVDGAGFALGRARDDGPVGFLGMAGGEFGLRFMQGSTAQGDDQAAGGIGIQPMGEPRPVAAAGELGEAILDAGAAARAGMDRQAGGFVQHGEARVLMKNWYVHAAGG